MAKAVFFLVLVFILALVFTYKFVMYVETIGTIHDVWGNNPSLIGILIAIGLLIIYAIRSVIKSL